ncbi:NTP transferase domain-containing protein [Paenibacillus rhizovicinus]|uniref:NTP transferase domain-containing protein n=1 Tax=Paenibacillus rhizovicinus TaxID=2704463 RepID=A0A6C0NTH3_9BACL|nr:NTP transferase domain-containing protein [Paenibacillus rhizovicinus]QHW29467.1 NTP transferase domain-containing protein [Paenibacillus rhizovicinus]
MTIAGVYLAAGAGSRMGGCKPAAELLPGVSLGGMGLLALLASGLDAVYVVVRPGDPLGWLPEDAVLESKPYIVVCEEAALGMAHSLRRGIACAAAAGHEAAIVALADQPFVTPALLRGLTNGWRSEPGLDYIACGLEESTMPPVLLARSLFGSVNGLSGDQGAKRLLAEPGVTGGIMPIREPTLVFDVDTPDELEAAKGIAWSYARIRNIQEVAIYREISK